MPIHQKNGPQNIRRNIQQLCPFPPIWSSLWTVHPMRVEVMILGNGYWTIINSAKDNFQLLKGQNHPREMSRAPLSFRTLFILLGAQVILPQASTNMGWCPFRERHRKECYCCVQWYLCHAYLQSYYCRCTSKPQGGPTSTQTSIWE